MLLCIFNTLYRVSTLAQTNVKQNNPNNLWIKNY